MEPQPKIRVIIYTLRLEFPEEIEVNSGSLADRVLDALMDYDFENKLLPGVPLPKYGDRLTGLMCSFESEGRIPDWRPPRDPDWEPSPLQETSKDKRLEIIGVSGDIDIQIQTLTDAQAALWKAYDKLTRAADTNDVRKGKSAATKALNRARKLLGLSDSESSS